MFPLFHGGTVPWNLTGRIVVFFHHNIFFVQLDKLSPVSSYGHGSVWLYETVNGNGSLFSCRNGVNGKFRPGIHVSPHENISLAALVSKGICNGPVPRP